MTLEDMGVEGFDNLVEASLAPEIAEEFMLGGMSIRQLAHAVHPLSRSVGDIEQVIREFCRLRSLEELQEEGEE
jgi:hypothetical protein